MPASLTLGPILFHWEADRKRDFYARIADECAVDTVYLGEVVCSKRAPFFEQHIPDMIERLERAGKRVVLSSLAEVVLPRERAATEALCGGDGYEVEINNAAGFLAARGRPHRIGQLMNVYNVETLGHLVTRGATHASLPAELPGSAVALLARAGADLGVGIEVQIFGRASLALSSRCYHARAHGRHKDNCQFVCEQDPDGMPLRTMEGQDFLAVNGIQTLSHSYVNLAGEVPALLDMGVTHLRLAPHTVDMVAVAAIFADQIRGAIDPAEAMARFGELGVDAPFSNGFWHGIAGYRHQPPLRLQRAV